MTVGRGIVGGAIAAAVASVVFVIGAFEARADVVGGGANDVAIANVLDAAAPRAGTGRVPTDDAADTMKPSSVAGRMAAASEPRASLHDGLAIAPQHRSSALGAIGLLICALLAVDRRARPTPRSRSA